MCCDRERRIVILYNKYTFKNKKQNLNKIKSEMNAFFLSMFTVSAINGFTKGLLVRLCFDKLGISDRRHINKMVSLKSLIDIPIKYRSIFQTINRFNQIQSSVFDDVMHSGEFSFKKFVCCFSKYLYFAFESFHSKQKSTL